MKNAFPLPLMLLHHSVMIMGDYMMRSECVIVEIYGMVVIVQSLYTSRLSNHSPPCRSQNTVQHACKDQIRILIIIT
jgi:hypothetical protein